MKDLPPVSWGKQNLNQTEDIYVCMKYVYACPDFFFYWLVLLSSFLPD